MALAAMAAADAAAGTQWGARACGVVALAGLGGGAALWHAVRSRSPTSAPTGRERGAGRGGGEEPYTYWVSPHEISRIPWLLSSPALAHQFRRLTAEEAAAGATADFVWLHKSTKSAERLRGAAKVCSLLSGFEALEDKRNLALLQQRMSVPTLTSFVCEAPAQLRRWCATRLGSGGAGGMWMVKDAGGNGGDGLWVLTRENHVSPTTAR